MKKQDLIKRFETILSDLEGEMSAYAYDFAQRYCGWDIEYLSDAFMEFADSETSIYYWDQRNYYNEHTEDCLDAIKCTYGSLHDFIECCNIEELDEAICKAGALGEYETIYNNLDQDKKLIIKYLIAYQIIEMLKNSEANFCKCLGVLHALSVDAFDKYTDTFILDDIFEYCYL